MFAHKIFHVTDDVDPSIDRIDTTSSDDHNAVVANFMKTLEPDDDIECATIVPDVYTIVYVPDDEQYHIVNCLKFAVNDDVSHRVNVLRAIFDQCNTWDAFDAMYRFAITLSKICH